MRYNLLIAGLLFFSLLSLPDYSTGQSRHSTAANFDYRRIFNGAYAQYPAIPRGLLESVAWCNTRMRHVQPDREPPSCIGLPPAWGIMGLIEDGKGYFRENLRLVSQLSGIPAQELKTSPVAQIYGYAAAVDSLMHYYHIQSTAPSDFIPVLRALGEIPEDGNPVNDFAINSQIFEYMRFLNDAQQQQRWGFPAYQLDLQRIFGPANYQVLSAGGVVIQGRSIRNNQGQNYQPQYRSADYPPALWNPAASCNYSSRYGTPISAVTIHTIQGSYAGAISWFQNCAANVSAHYVLRSSDGQVTQMVREADKAWHVGSENPYTIGLEHEGYVSDPSWYTQAMYVSSANLVKDITNSGYGINPLRTFDLAPRYQWNTVTGGCIKIKGHVNFPNQTHTDPGVYWDWKYYYELINDNPSVTVFTAPSGVFYDSGGPSANYGDDERKRYLIQPPNASGITLTINSFNLETDWDYLYIYDGPTSASQLIGVYTGTAIPSTIQSTGGSILLEFRSDCATTESGWEISWNSQGSDITPPVTQISGVQGWQTTDFQVTFNDADNTGGSGIFQGFYQVLEYNGSEWQANRNLGFFNDNFNMLSSDWTIYSGTWSSASGHLIQTDINDGNANIYIGLNQHAENIWLYHWKMKIDGNSSNRRAGLHFFCDNAALPNRGNSYFVYYRVDHEKVQIYKVENDSWALKSNDDFTIDPGVWYDCKVIYDPASGLIQAYCNDQLVSEWTDPSPLTMGGFISPRTGNAQVEYDDLKVYLSRNQNVTITVGNGNNKAVRFGNASPSQPACRIKSIAVDNAGNISVPASLDVNIDFTPPSMVSVNDGSGQDIDVSNDLTSITANWASASDPNSGIKGYWMAVGTSAGMDDISGWQYIGNATVYTKTGLQLTPGQVCYTSIIAENNAGLFSPVNSSDGVLIQLSDYCQSMGVSTRDEWIHKVCIDNHCSRTGDNGGYADLTHLRPALAIGETHSLYLVPGFSSSTFSEYWRVWIDYNQDKDFDDPGELVFETPNPTSSPVLASFTIPSSALSGETRIRFQMKWLNSPSSCEVFDWGEVEDYSLWLFQPCPEPDSLWVTNLTATTATLNWNATNAIKYEVKIRRQGYAWHKIITTQPYHTLNTALRPNTIYQFKVKSVCVNNKTSAYSEKYTFITPANNARIATQRIDNATPGFTVIPNPASERVTVSVTDGLKRPCDLWMFNSEGKCIYKKSALTTGEIIDVSNFPDGIYVILLKGDDILERQKLIITR